MKRMFQIIIIMLCINLAQLNLFSGRNVPADSYDYTESIFGSEQEQFNKFTNLNEDKNESSFKDIHISQKSFSLKIWRKPFTGTTSVKSDLTVNFISGLISVYSKYFSLYKFSNSLYFHGCDFSYLRVIRI